MLTFSLKHQLLLLILLRYNSRMHKEMTATDVIKFNIDLEKSGIAIWIDGGWGVDALLGKQTRLHADLDIAIEQKYLKKAVGLLEKHGYQNVPHDDTCPWNFVLGDNKGHEIDFHVIVIDDNGNGIYGPPEKGEMYPAGALVGQGRIKKHPVKCIAPDYMVKFHTGYKLRESDYQDIGALCKKFRIALPEEYVR